MNTSVTNIILAGIALAGFLGILISIPSRTNKLRKNAGILHLALKTPSPVKSILILVFSAVLIVLVPLRNMGLFVNIVLLLTALIAAEMGIREFANLRIAGVYKDAIVSGTQTIYFNKITALPTLSYEDDPESTGNYKTSLNIVLENGTETTLVFADEEERTQAVKTILQLVPRLRP